MRSKNVAKFIKLYGEKREENFKQWGGVFLPA